MELNDNKMMYTDSHSHYNTTSYIVHINRNKEQNNQLYKSFTSHLIK